MTIEPANNPGLNAYSTFATAHVSGRNHLEHTSELLERVRVNIVVLGNGESDNEWLAAHHLNFKFVWAFKPDLEYLLFCLQALGPCNRDYIDL